MAHPGPPLDRVNGLLFEQRRIDVRVRLRKRA
jgi:hypothetical protein